MIVGTQARVRAIREPSEVRAGHRTVFASSTVHPLIETQSAGATALGM